MQGIVKTFDSDRGIGIIHDRNGGKYPVTLAHPCTQTFMSYPTLFVKADLAPVNDYSVPGFCLLFDLPFSQRANAHKRSPQSPNQLFPLSPKAGLVCSFDRQPFSAERPAPEKKLSFHVRTALFCIVLLTVCRDATATSVLLLSASKAPPELFPVQTYAGKSDVSISAIQPSSSVTVVLLMDTLSPAQFDSAKKDLLALYASLHRHPLRLALLRNSSLGVAGPFASRGRLKSAFDEAAQAASDPAPVSPSAIIDTLCAAAPQLGSDWSHVLLIGEFPALDPSALDYAAALLLRAFGTQRIQLSWSAPSGGNDAWLPILR